MLSIKIDRQKLTKKLTTTKNLDKKTETKNREFTVNRVSIQRPPKLRNQDLLKNLDRSDRKKT